MVDEVREVEKMIRWDKCNKWLHIGERFILLFDNWHWISNQPTIRQWCLPVMKDGKVDRRDFTTISGTLPCFVQIVIFGVGFRVCYDRGMTVCLAKTPGDMDNG